MSPYRRVWLLLWGAVTGLGMVLAMMAWPIGWMIMVFMAGAAIVGTTAFILHDLAGKIIPGTSARFARTCAGWGGSAVVAVAGLGAVVHLLVLAVLFLAVATSPRAVCSYRRHAFQPDRVVDPINNRNCCTAAVPTDASTFAASIHVLKDAELCHAWCVSYALLQQAHTAALRGYIVALRQAYLDECAARNPSGLTAWFDSGARAGGNPEKFLTGGNELHPHNG